MLSWLSSRVAGRGLAGAGCNTTVLDTCVATVRWYGFRSTWTPVDYCRSDPRVLPGRRPSSWVCWCLRVRSPWRPQWERNLVGAYVQPALVWLMRSHLQHKSCRYIGNRYSPLESKGRCVGRCLTLICGGSIFMSGQFFCVSALVSATVVIPF